MNLDEVKKQQKGSVKMGSLRKLVKSVDQEKVAAQEQRYTPAEEIKIAAANLVNFINDTVAAGGRIKEASAKEEINQDFIAKLGKLYVKNHYDLHKQAAREESAQKLVSVFKDSK